MKKALCLMIVGLMATIASAGVTAEWQQSVGAMGDVFKLQVVANTEGVALSGMDIKVTGVGFVFIPDLVFSPALVGTYTVANMPPASIVLSAQGVSSTELSAAAVYKVGMGDMGMTPTLLSIVVPTGTITDPYTQLVVSATEGATPMVRPGSLASVPLVVPEPMTMSLLGVGALALLRRRK